MSLYADYLTEKTSEMIIESDTGFATYRFINEGRSVYIVDIYVTPKARKAKEASSMADKICEIAKDQGCTDLIGTVIPSNKNSSTSLDVLRSFGMEIQSASNDLIIFRKAL